MSLRKRAVQQLTFYKFKSLHFFIILFEMTATFSEEYLYRQKTE